MTFRHSEAYCLMLYRSDFGTEEELIWNSRDGVTPFVVMLKSGTIATHVDWSLDKYLPDYRPAIGSRVFVDLTPERARELARRALQEHVDYYAKYLPRQSPPTIEELVQSYLEPEGTPDLIEVTQEWLDSYTNPFVELLTKLEDLQKTVRNFKEGK